MTVEELIVWLIIIVCLLDALFSLYNIRRNKKYWEQRQKEFWKEYYKLDKDQK